MYDLELQHMKTLVRREILYQNPTGFGDLQAKVWELRVDCITPRIFSLGDQFVDDIITTGSTGARGSVQKGAEINSGWEMKNTGNKTLKLNNRKWNQILEFSLESI